MSDQVSNTDIKRPLSFREKRRLSERKLRRIARRVARCSDITTFRAAVTTGIGVEEDVGLPPLRYLPQLQYFICVQCRSVLSSEKQALTRHINRKHTVVPRNRAESRTLSSQLDEILQYRGTPNRTDIDAILHGKLIFLSLSLRLDGLACLQSNCSWVYAPGSKDAHHVARRHMNKAHGIYLTPRESHYKHYVAGLPVHTIQGQKGNHQAHFITAFPPSRRKQKSQRPSRVDAGTRTPVVYK